MKQAQAAAAGMALLALMFTGCSAKTPAGPGPGAAAKPAGEPAASAAPSRSDYVSAGPWFRGSRSRHQVTCRAEGPVRGSAAGPFRVRVVPAG